MVSPTRGLKDMSESLFWSLVRASGISESAVKISKAVVVDGGLSPPPSKVYPGRKCYYVNLQVGGKAVAGFGPTPGVARRVALIQACNTFIGKDYDSDSEDGGLEVVNDACLVPVHNHDPRNDDVFGTMHEVARRKGVKIQTEIINTAGSEVRSGGVVLACTHYPFKRHGDYECFHGC